MDHQCNTDRIEPLEATALSTDEKAETEPQTSVSLEGYMNWIGPGVDFRCDIRRRGRGRTIMGGRGGCRATPPVL